MINREEKVSGWDRFPPWPTKCHIGVRVSSLMMRSSLETGPETGPKILDLKIISTELDYLLLHMGIVHFIVESTMPVLRLGCHQIETNSAFQKGGTFSAWIWRGTVMGDSLMRDDDVERSKHTDL